MVCDADEHRSLFLVALFAVPEPEPGSAPTGRSSSLLTFALAALGTFIVVISFAVNESFLSAQLSTRTSRWSRKALVVAWAMCEVSALIGLLGTLYDRQPRLLSAVSRRCNRNRTSLSARDNLQAATYKTPSEQMALVNMSTAVKTISRRRSHRQDLRLPGCPQAASLPAALPAAADPGDSPYLCC